MRFRIFISLLFFAASAQAKPYFAPDFISQNSINPALVEGSLEWKNEINQVIKLQKNPDFDEVDEAFEERNLKLEMVAQFVDASLTRKQNPQLYNLLERANDTAWAANTKVKKYWQEKRPYLADSRIKLFIPTSGSSSYPSSHTCKSYVAAHVLGLVFPQKKSQFLKRAEEISHHRILVGLHFPKDTQGGKQLALLIVEALRNNAEFLSDLQKARAEVVGK